MVVKYFPCLQFVAFWQTFAFVITRKYLFRVSQDLIRFRLTSDVEFPSGRWISSRLPHTFYATMSNVMLSTSHKATQ